MSVPSPAERTPASATDEQPLAGIECVLRRRILRVEVLAEQTAAAAPRLCELVEVRVGKHPTFTRVVFELDRAAGYRIERSDPSMGVAELIVSLEASSAPRSISKKKALIEQVDVEPNGRRSVARVRLSQEGLRLKEMILANPPRIVLDLLNEYRPDAPYFSVYVTSFIMGEIARQGLEAAAANGDLTRAGVVEALGSTTIDMQGLIPDINYGGNANDDIPRNSYIFDVSTAAYDAEATITTGGEGADGLTLIEGDYVGDVAASFEYEACFEI